MFYSTGSIRHLLFFFGLALVVVFCRDFKSKLLPGRDVCGIQEEQRIYGGTECEIGEYPWLVLVGIKENAGTDDETYNYYCGGALINKRYILTAAHCFANVSADAEVIVRLGEHNIQTEQDCDDDTSGLEYCADESYDLDVTDKIIHEEFDPHDISFHNDISLLRLADKVSYTDFVKPICLPLSENLQRKNYIGTRVVVGGWGANENGTRSDVKLKVEVPVKPNADCAKHYAKDEANIISSQICAGGEKGKDSCRGDSGGPLMYRHRTYHDENWVAIGIVSFGDTTCGVEDAPACYTRVTDHLDWIIKNIRP